MYLAPKIVRLLLDAGASVNEPSRALPKHQIFNRLVYTANPFPLSQLYNDWLDIERKQMRSEMHLPLSNACINGNLGKKKKKFFPLFSTFFFFQHFLFRIGFYFD